MAPLIDLPRSVIGFSTGLDELTVYGRTVTSETIASGAGQLGGSSTWGAVELASPLPSGYHWLALDVTSPGGWSSLTLQQVFVPEPASLAVFAAVAVGLAVRRRSPVADRARGQACRGKGPRGA